MNRQRQRQRRNTVTRSYPVYALSASDFSDNDDDDISVIEIRPIKQHRHRRKHVPKVRRQESIPQYVVTDNRNRQVAKAVPERTQKSATIQTDDSGIISTETKKDESSSKKSKHRCLRIVTLILAVFLLIISLLLLAFSLNLLLNPNMTKIRTVAIVYAQALPTSGFYGKGPTDTLLVAAIVGIIYASIMLITSVVCIICLACIKFHYYGFLYIIGVILLFFLFIILIGLALFIMITGDTELQRLAYSTQTVVYLYYNSSSTTLVRDGWDFVQYYFGCCGVKTNNTDWYPPPSTGWKYNSLLPRSCCGYDPNDAGHAGRIFIGTSVPSLIGFCYYGDIGQPTCYDSIRTNLLATVLVFLISVALIVLIIIILFIVLLVTYRKIHTRVEDSIKK